MPKKKPLGKSLPLTDEQLDELARVTETDVAQARAQWMANAPEWAAGLIEAQEKEMVTDA